MGLRPNCTGKPVAKSLAPVSGGEKLVKSVLAEAAEAAASDEATTRAAAAARRKARRRGGQATHRVGSRR